MRLYDFDKNEIEIGVSSGYFPLVQEWNAMGDSITYGVGTSKTYLDILKEKYGITIANNYSSSGTSIAKHPNYGGEFCSRVNQMTDTADLVTVLGGTNDFLHDVPIGTSNDTSNTTFYGAMKILIEELLQKYPNSYVVFLTPVRCKDGWGELEDNANTNSLGNTLADYVSVIKEMCKHYSVPVIDLYNISGLEPNYDLCNKTYFSDGLHLKDKGHERIAEILEKAFI